MSTNSEPDPLELVVNGELANDVDIAVMEGLAKALLAPIPAELHRRYPRVTDGGAIALFGTYSYEEDEPAKLHANLALARADCDNMQLLVNFSQDNECSISFQEQDAMPEVARIAQELLDDGQLSAVERTIIGHLQAVALSLGINEYPERTSIVATSHTPDSVVPVVDLIKNLVTANTSNVVRTKEYGVAIDDDHYLTITEHAVEGRTASDITVSGIPKLQIEYEDRPASTTYCYTRYQDGETALEVFDPASIEPAMDYAALSQDDEMIEQFMEELEKPRRADVELLTGQLLDAALIDATAPEDPAN